MRCAFGAALDGPRLGFAALGICLAFGLALPANADVLDFETVLGEPGQPLMNGQAISEFSFGGPVSISTSGSNLGAAIFASTIGGANAGGPDPDLLVDLGNVLIFQNNGNPDQSVPGMYDTPNDDPNGGTFTFSFSSPVILSSIDLVDIDGGNQDATVMLVDADGNSRTYDVPSGWTNDIDADGPVGWDTLDLTTLSSQLGEGGSTATAMEDDGFDASNVVALDVTLRSSGAIDNIVFDVVPAPGAAALLIAPFCARRRRRKN